MRTEIIYYADDGTRFDDKYECEEYEQKLKSSKFKNTAFLFDEDGKPLPLTDNGFEAAGFILCKTDEAAEYVYDQMHHGLYTPWDSYGDTPSAGCWQWVDDTWTPVSEILDEAKSTIALIERVLNH